MERLFKWAREAEEPLRIYATGLLAGAMENQDIAANYREENSVLVCEISSLTPFHHSLHSSIIRLHLLLYSVIVITSNVQNCPEDSFISDWPSFNAV